MAADPPPEVAATMSVKRSLAWMAMGQGAYFLLQFGGSVALARLLSPYEMGVFAIALAVVGLIGILQAIGLNNYLVRERELDPQMLATVFTINIVIAVLLGSAIAGLGLLGETIFKEPGVRHVLVWLSATPLIGAIGFMPTTLLEREGDFRAVALLKTGSMIIGTFSTVGFALAGFSFMSLAYGQVIAAIANAAAANLIAPRHIHVRFAIGEWREVSGFGMQMLAISGVSRISMRLSEMLLARLLGLSALGLYSRASSMFNLLWDNVHIVIARILFVDFANLARADIPLRDRYKQVLEMLTALLWPAFAVLAVLAGPFVNAVYGAQWSGSALPLTMLCIAGILYVSVTMTWEIFVVANETGRQARFEFARSGFGLVLFGVGCLVSLDAAAATRIGEALFAALLYAPHITRITRSVRGDFAPIYLRSALLTLVAVAPATALMLLHGWSASTPIGLVLLSVALGVALWFATLKFLRHPLFEEVRTLMLRHAATAP